MQPYHLLRREQLIARPVGEVFEFFSRPENLARITPPELSFQIITPSPIAMREGALIDYTIRVLGVPIRWTTMITAFDAPHGFVDQQIRGPYDFWHHTHRFAEASGGTLMTDEVRYRVGWGPLGETARLLFVRRNLDQIFDFRASSITSILSEKAP